MFICYYTYKTMPASYSRIFPIEFMEYHTQIMGNSLEGSDCVWIIPGTLNYEDFAA